MKTILFPTDFSECAGNALKWAAAFAEKYNAKLILHNCCHLPVFSMQVPFDGITEEQVYNEASAQMKEFISKNKPGSINVLFESSVSVGLVGDEIVSLAEEKNADMIIMGTKGASGMEKVLIGSNAATIIERSSCPVIAVPEHAVFRGINKIIYAADYQEQDISSIKTLVDIAAPYLAEICIVHVSSITGTDALERDLFNAFKEEVRKKVHYEKMSFELAVGLKTENDLDTIIKEQNADLLAMSMRKRNLFSRLFSPSLTRRMSYHTSVPLLAFHSS